MKVKRSSPDRRTMDGIVFDSIAEMQRYAELKLLHRIGLIEGLKCHPQFTIEVNGKRICSYSPDFTYRLDGKVVVEDVKGFKRSKKTGKLLPRVDREFGIKKKLMKACFGLDVEVV